MSVPLTTVDVDESYFRFVLRRALHDAQPHPLSSAPRFDTAVVYVMCTTGHSFAPYRRLGPNYPIYIGAAAPGRDRCGEHRRSIAGVENLDVGDFDVRFVGVGTRGAALFAEDILLDAYKPLFNTVITGLGCKPQSHARTGMSGGGRGQRASRFDSLHPGRSAVSRRDPHPTEELLDLVGTYMDDSEALRPSLALPR